MPIDQPRPFNLASSPCVIAEASEKKLGTFTGLAYSGAQMRPEGWWNDIVIDLAGVRHKDVHAVLRQHDHEQIVGHTTAIRVDGRGISIEGVLSGQAEHVAKIVQPAKNGFPWQMSIGASPIRTEFLEAGKEAEVNGRTITGPTTISRETDLGEISFVPVGADDETSATISARKGKTMNPFAASLKQLMADRRIASKSAKYSDSDVDQMSAEDAKLALKQCMAEEDDDAEAAEEEETEAAADDDAEAAEEEETEASANEEDEEDEDEESESSRRPAVSSGKKNTVNAKKKGARMGSIKVNSKAIMAQLRRDMAIDTRRQREITAACRQHGALDLKVKIKGQSVNLVDHAIEAGWSIARVKAQLLDHVRDERPSHGVVPGGLGFTTSEPATNEAVLEAAVLQAARHQFRLNDDSFYSEPTPDGKSSVRRVPQYIQAETQQGMKARYTDQVQQTAHTLFKGQITPHRLIAEAFRANGIRELDLRSEHGIRAMLQTWDRTEIRAEGASNLSISNILANVMNKFALQGYLNVEQAYREISAIRPVSDFKPIKSINLLGDVMFKALGPTSELANASLGDQAFANQAAPFGRILTIPWTHLVNDDLGMLTGAPMKMGQGAGLALNDFFWKLWAAMAAGSVNGDDGNAFWRTTSSTTNGKAYKPNKTTGALTNVTLQTAKALFDNQVDPNGNPLGFDGTMPILLHGPSQWQNVNQLLYGAVLIATGLASTSASSVAPATNVWAGTMRPVMSRYIENALYGNSTTAYWILFNPVALPVIEICFLNGIDTPSVLQAGPDYQFDRLGISIRGTMPFGVTQQNFRGGVYSTGA